jgi:hypothetical protein
LALKQTHPDKFASFAEFVSADLGIPSDIVSVVLKAVARSGPAWLIKHHKPIDLGFVKLMAVPFRANWKEIVMFKGKARDLIGALLATKHERLRRLAAMRFPAMLCSPQNIALIGGRNYTRIDYSVEAVTTAAFERAAEQIEDERILHGDYVAQYGKVIERLYDSIVDCLVHYTQKTQAAWASVCKSSDGSGAALIPAKPKPIRGVHLADLPVDIIPTGNDFSVFAEGEGTSQRIYVPAPADEVPQVSVVPPPADDLRQRIGNGSLVESRPGGTNGLSLLPPSENLSTRQSMFSGGSTETWCPPRMDRE